MLGCKADFSSFGTSNELVGGQFAIAGKQLIYPRSLERFEQMAKQRRTALQRFRKFVKAGAGLVNGAYGPRAVKIVESAPL